MIITKRNCFTFFILIILCLYVNSCSKTEEPLTGIRKDGLYGYSSTFFDIPYVDGCKILRSNVFLDGEDYCVSTLYCRDEDQLLLTKIYTVLADGTVKNTLELEGDQAFGGKVDDNYGLFSYDDNAVYILNDKGKVLKKIESSLQAYGCCYTSVGIWFYSTKEYEFYPNGSDKGIKIQADVVLVDCEQPVVEDHGKYYIVEDLERMSKYYEVDLETGKTEYSCSTEDFELNSYLINGKYSIENENIYTLDLENKTLNKIADLNDIDTRPPLKAKYMGEYMKFADDDLFFRVYSYTDGTGEVQIYTYDNTIDNKTKKIITIGGYGLTNDVPLNLAIYEYNTSHKDYRIHTIDYFGIYPMNNREDYIKSVLDLMKEFQNGNAPDIFYGNKFDYEYMGRNGMVLDLLSCDMSFKIEKFSLPIREIVTDSEGHCYQAFPSYTINGYWGSEEHFADNANVSVKELEELSQKTNLPIFNYVFTENLVDTIIRYPVKNLWGIEQSEKSINLEKMESIINFSVNNSRPLGNQSQISVLEFSDCLVSELQVGSLDYIGYFERTYGEKLVYIGYPSVETSVHLASPNGLVAISSSTCELDACCDFVNILFGENVQKVAAVNGGIPVSEDVLKDMISCLQIPSSCSDPVWRSMTIDRNPITDDTVNTFLQAISSVDTLEFYDWGISDIIYDEVETHYSQGRTIEETATIILNRIDLYIDENY